MARITKNNKRVKESTIYNIVRGSLLGITTSEISAETGLPIRTIYNYLYRLETKNVLYRDGRCWFWDYGY
jgi:hypothetical protein